MIENKKLKGILKTEKKRKRKHPRIDKKKLFVKFVREKKRRE
jgi:hypothetical protein